MKYLFLALFFISQFAQATECAPVNLVTQANSPFRKIPVYDQDGTGICYAYASAQLADYHLIKNGARERNVHPAWLALANSTKLNRPTLNSGRTKDTLNAVFELQNCPYNVVQGALSVWAQKAQVTESELLNLIELYTPKYDSLKRAKRAQGILDNRTYEISREEITTILNECSPSSTWGQLVPELYALSVMGSDKLFESLMLPACQGKKTSVDIPAVKTQFLNSDADVITQLDNKIANGPASITYCSNFLFDKTYSGVSMGESYRDRYAPDCQSHESIIVGKKKVGESCQFLLRNSWGNGFNKSTDAWKCLCKDKSTGAFVDDCTSATHNNGKYSVEGCWLDENSLAKNTILMTTLEGTR